MMAARSIKNKIESFVGVNIFHFLQRLTVRWDLLLSGLLPAGPKYDRRKHNKQLFVFSSPVFVDVVLKIPKRPRAQHLLLSGLPLEVPFIQ